MEFSESTVQELLLQGISQINFIALQSYCWDVVLLRLCP